MKYEFQYDVALSYASEQYEYVRDVAYALQSYELKVFFDRFDHEQINLWGENLIDKFYDIFAKKSKYCVMFLSENYSDKEWTLHEFDSMQIRNLKKQNNVYILPVRFDNTELKSFNPAVSYLNAKNYTPQQLAEIIYNKVTQLTNIQKNSKNISYITLKEAYKELLFLIDEQLKKRTFDEIHIETADLCNGRSYTFFINKEILFYLQFFIEEEKTPPHITIYDSTFVPPRKRNIQTAEILLDNSKLIFLNYGLFYSDKALCNETMQTISEKIIEKIHNYLF